MSTARLGSAVASAARRLDREERGLTVVEGLVAALLLVVGALGVLQVFDASARNNYRTEESQVVVNRLQAELEQIQQLPYERIAMSSNPGTSADHNDPRWRVSGSSFALAQSGTDPHEMVIEADGFSPGPEPFTAGDVSGQIYRFVTWAPADPMCADCGDEFVKRVVVAARLDEAAISFERRFQEVQTDIVDPAATPNENPAPPADEGTSTVALWLTDTPCDAAEPAEVIADHPTHNTRGVCPDGPKTGATPGAPDLLAIDQPPLTSALFDYADDVEPAQDPGDDKGLLLRAPDANGCLLSGDPLDLPDTDEIGHERMHKWLSPPLPEGDDLLLRGAATVELPTQTLNAAIHGGAICVWLFVRERNVDDQRVDTPVVNRLSPTGETQFIKQLGSWPTVWEKLGIELDFFPTTVQPGEQVGLAIQVERSGTTGGEGLQFMYNHPELQGRVEMETDRVLPF